MALNQAKVTWNNLALIQLEEVFYYVINDSLQNAIKVKNDLLAISRSLSAHPEKFPLDKYKINNDGTYRAFQKHRYRVVYRVLKTGIKIISLRHTSMDPIEY